MSERILIVEDELNLQETLAYNLARQGYVVDTAGDGNLAVSLAHDHPPDLILLDIMLPGMDGFEVCRVLRKELNVPIIFLTARADEIDRVVAFEIGGDDFISKPFSMRELIARVKARLRMTRLLHQPAYLEVAQGHEQAPEPGTGALLRFGNLQINPARREVLLNGTPLVMKPREFELIEFFAHNRGRVFSRDQLLQQLWGYDFAGDSRTVDVHVHWVREKIEPDLSNPVRIVTVRNVGYRFEG